MKSITPSRKATLAQATTEIQTAWEKYRQVETLGLAFGKTIFRWRKQFGARGSRSGGGLAQILSKLGIGEGKAYYWNREYEISIGLRQQKTVEELENEDEDGLPCWEMTEEEVDRAVEKAKKQAAAWRAAHPGHPSLGANIKVTPAILEAAAALIEMGYRTLAKKHHPDIGGSHLEMSDLNQAVAWLREKVVAGGLNG